jgi:hypothetical protein
VTACKLTGPAHTPFPLLWRQNVTSCVYRLDLIDARQGLSDIRRRQVRAALLEQIRLAVEEEQEECARLADRMAEV